MPVAEMDTFRSPLTSSSNPMITNSVTPIPNAPTASAYKARGMTVSMQGVGTRMMRADGITDKNVPAHDRRASNERIPWVEHMDNRTGEIEAFLRSVEGG